MFAETSGGRQLSRFIVVVDLVSLEVDGMIYSLDRSEELAHRITSMSYDL